MTFPAPRSLLPGGMLVTLLAGCASSGRTDGSDPGDTPRPAVTADDIERNPSQPIEQQLMSRFPGVVVTRTPAGLAFRIRGATSLYGSTQPLFVIDGIATQPGADGTLFGINPYEIESIEVLKDAASTTEYGARGANGVIVIKTKQAGRRDDETSARPSSPGATVTAEEIERNPSQPIEKLLESRFPGVDVVRTADGGIAVRIRGRTSIYGSNDPLYVIDGVAIEPGPGGALFGINPYDIETIDILKDPTSTTMYGVRGANGVIVIETKQTPRP